MFAKSLLVVVVLALCVFARSAEAIDMNLAASGDAAWNQAYINLGEEYPVVDLYGYNGTSWTGCGCGTVISSGTATSSRYVIGAAHCASSTAVPLFQEYAVVTGNNVVSDYWGIYYTSTVSVIPQYTGVISSPDIAVWTFPRPSQT